jgi:hypothetical protein
VLDVIRRYRSDRRRSFANGLSKCVHLGTLLGQDSLLTHALASDVEIASTGRRLYVPNHWMDGNAVLR